MWKTIPGYRSSYRINEQGTVQQLTRGAWVDLAHQVSSSRAEVRLRGIDGRQKRRGVFQLLDQCFCGGYAKKNGLRACPKNGMKSDCRLENLCYRTQAEIGRKALSRHNKKVVRRIDRRGDFVEYPSIAEAAAKNGLSRSSLDRRIRGEVLDPRGLKWEIVK